MSHTVSIDLKFKNPDASTKAVEAMGGKVLGEGTHRLYGSSHTGLGIQLPRWQYPCIIDKDGKIFYDNYGGSWGSPAELERFQELYAQKVIEAECEQMGWYCERVDTGDLVVHHPSGGTITVSKGGTLDASGFVGNTCELATERFENALGTKLGAALKPLINEVQVNQTE